MEKRERLKEILRRESLRRGRFVLASGKRSSYYFDGKLTTLDSEGARLVAELLLDVLSDYDVGAIGGLTLGADPIVGALLALAPERGRKLKGFLVRKEPKDHGTRSRVEGPLDEGQGVAIIEDVVTTGGSALQAADVVEALGCTVRVVLAVVDRGEGGAEAFSGRGYPFRALFSAEELLEEEGPAAR